MTTNDAQRIERANATDRVPVVFVHGLWLLPSGWDRCAAHLRPVPLRLRQRGNPGVTEITEIPNRGHALAIDRGWQEVADTALEFVRRFA
ncbi:hypothetical protein [Streptomyces mirabilis]|uniref:hypothetical protein n=1 Tax=Streptomyces mirabilis TaxID=68239 RepID=UPI00201D99EE|nr:hypothetical protein [Streptomyces mirabilis]